MARRIVKVAAALVLLGLIIPQAVEAAAAAFTSASAAVPAVKGTNSAAATGAKGVEGYASGASGTTYGVIGTAKSPNGFGVYGQNQWGSGKAVGVYGKSISSTGHAIEGYAASPAGAGCTTVAACQHFGVAGYTQGGSDSPTPLISGVYGQALSGDGFTNGVTGISNALNPEGVGVRGIAESGIGIEGEGEWGVLGFGLGTAAAIEGQNYGDGPGVEGISFGSNRYGVVSDNDLGVVEHLVGTGNLAGDCTILASASTSGSSCLGIFSPGFPTSDGVPIIVLTPVGDPGADRWWISSWSSLGGFYTGFTVTRNATPATAASFNYLAVGRDGSLASRPARVRQRTAALRYER